MPCFFFAHHDMLGALDLLHLHPTTTGEHVAAFALYALLLAGVGLAGRAGSRWYRRALASWRRPAVVVGPEAIGLAEQAS